MKILKPSFIFVLAALSIFACNAQSPDKQKTINKSSGDLQVYYFHFTKRCATCNAVENETRAALEMFYSDQLNEGKIDFTSLNLEDEKGKEIAQTLKVTGQALLLVKGDKQVNLTNEGFMNARTKPDKFHEVLKTQIEKLL